ncbi:MAG TPA: alpha-galactosidase [Verrucomicrobiae bacterium]|nr:alpha-galactosidase [Verrucomicrobiae bacterium]
MVRYQRLLVLGMLACAWGALRANPSAGAESDLFISITTARSCINLFVGEDGRLYELGYGSREFKASYPKGKPAREAEFHPAYGNGFICEPALQVTHADGNTSTDLRFAKSETTNLDANVTLTRIELKDSFYPFYATLCFKSYVAEDLIEQWTEFNQQENGPVTLLRFASSAPAFRAKEYWLTQFQGDYAREANMVEEQLEPGIKVLDSKIGVRASRFRLPSFVLALDGPAKEESGEVFGGSLAWSGSYQLAFEVDWDHRLRALCGINPFGSEYHLHPDVTFTTPSMLWTWSDHGKGQVSRNFHRWARRYGIRDGDQPRPVLLNNWEATGFKFDEQTVVSLFDGAKELGADAFLLDDGWFGNRHPRNADNAGLGDWQVNTNKLPHGLSHLAEQARQRGIRFGIWLEPEMVNPASDLFEQHPDWAIRQPHRELELSRNQLVLDLSRPEVREFAWNAIDNILGSNPGISYVKWDANRYVTQPGSTYLPPSEQSHLLIDYNFGLYDLMRRMTEKYPHVQAMLCSGGSGRADYGALKYFDSFWPSDNTDPRSRVFIQWGFSHFFPASTLCAHVTRMGRRPLKFTLDVALSGALGLDLDARKLKPEERRAIASAVLLYKQTVREITAQGDLFRLESPYQGPRSALDYVLPDRSRAVLFVYQLADDDANKPVRPGGLDPQRNYRVRELNLAEGTSGRLDKEGQIVPGSILINEGLVPACHREFDSSIIELIAEPAR